MPRIHMAGSHLNFMSITIPGVGQVVALKMGVLPCPEASNMTNVFPVARSEACMVWLFLCSVLNLGIMAGVALAAARPTDPKRH